jgi:hypothetical protein
MYSYLTPHRGSQGVAPRKQWNGRAKQPVSIRYRRHAFTREVSTDTPRVIQTPGTTNRRCEAVERLVARCCALGFLSTPAHLLDGVDRKPHGVMQTPTYRSTFDG